MNANRFRTDFKSSTDFAYESQVLDLSRVARVVKGGRRFRVRALVVLGDGKGMVGLGCAKGVNAPGAIAKAKNVAQRQMRRVILEPPTTIPHEVKAKVGGAQILLKPAKEGTGLIAGSVTRSILEMAGYHNIYSKSLGNSNKINLAYATMAALKKLVAIENWHLNNLNPAQKETTKSQVSSKSSKSSQ